MIITHDRLAVPTEHNLAEPRADQRILTPIPAPIHTALTTKQFPNHAE
jgi:hypothetical protein